jgi:6-phosphogluconolactonase
MPPSHSADDVTVAPDYEALSRRAARRVQRTIRRTLETQDEFALALAGGSTPRRLYQRLAEATLPWDRIHLYWGDERFVPHDHPKSNVRLVRETLLDGLDLPAAHVHPMPITGTSDDAAADYAGTLHQAFADRAHTFDLALLGMGADGHTASLFPEDDPSPDEPAWVRAVSAPPRHAISQRLTCTLPVFNDTRHALVLVSGASKREAVRAALYDRDSSLPIARIRPREQLTWLLDEAAHPLHDDASALPD